MGCNFIFLKETGLLTERYTNHFYKWMNDDLVVIHEEVSL